MNKEQLKIMRESKGFIGALDQSGGSTPKALKDYGINEISYENEFEMLTLVHEMRTRIICSNAFSSQHILGAILFENTMDREIKGMYTADYLWNEKKIIPFLKIDSGLDIENNDVQLMKEMPNLDELLKKAVSRNIFGTKMRSLIKEANQKGINEVIKQQFEVAKKICSYGLIPIIEPEIDINSKSKKEAEVIMKKAILENLKSLDNEIIMFKFSIPTEDNFYQDLLKEKNVLRIVALSGGYKQDVANELLQKNHGLIASFSRALLVNLSIEQNEEEFENTLKNSVLKIYEASIT